MRPNLQPKIYKSRCSIATLSHVCNYKVPFCAFKGDAQNLPLRRVGRGRSPPQQFPEINRYAFWSVLQYNVRMLFPSIETGTAMNARKSENYLPISHSFKCIKIVSRFFWPRYIGNDFFQGRDILGTTFNINNRKQFQITAHPIFCRFNHVLISGA